jgi:cytochrome c oxidase subunit 2
MSALFPLAASTFAPHVDALMGYVSLISLAFIVLVGGLILYFTVKYHHRARADRSRPVFFSLPLELAWTGVPLLLVLSIFFWGAKLFIAMREPPPDAMEIYVVGKQWMWDLQHAEGRREINELHIPIGRPVKLLMTSADVIHSFFVPAFRIKQDVLPGRYTTEWFEATAPGRYHLFCSQYCGMAHSEMGGEIIALSPADYALWLSGPATTANPKVKGISPMMAAAGAILFQKYKCAGCHTPNDKGVGPALQGLFGRKVELEGAGSVVMDEDYIRESILRPRAKIVKGFDPNMPTFEGRVTEDEILQLIAYIKSLKRTK